MLNSNPELIQVFICLKETEAVCRDAINGSLPNGNGEVFEKIMDVFFLSFLT